MILNGTKSLLLLKSKKSQHSIKGGSLKGCIVIPQKTTFSFANKKINSKQLNQCSCNNMSGCLLRALTAFKLSIALLLVLLGVHCSTRSELSSLRLQQSRKQSMLDSAWCLREKRELPPSTAIGQSFASAPALFKKKNAENPQP